MNGMAELITVKRHWERWADPRLVVAVLHNNDLNQVTWELRAMGGTPRFVESQALPDVEYAEFAASLGLLAVKVTEPEELAGARDSALSADRPCLIDVHCDPDVPPIPPHATLEEATDLAKALIKGDASRWGVIKEGIKVKAQEFLPHHDE
jgi:pyruvate dehydrogenase (quinone)